MTKNIAKLLIIKLILLVSPISLIAHGAGTIPYIKDKEKIYFLLSENGHQPGKWTDFSGSGKPKRWTNPIKSEKTNKNKIETSAQEVKAPKLDAQLVAQTIAELIERRINHKRASKRAALSSMRAGAKGIKICCTGKLHGAEIARSECIKIGSLPLKSIDYGFTEAKTTYGIIGVKVWIYK